MTPDPYESEIEELERLLVTLRPRPDDAFVERTERRLLGRQSRRLRVRTGVVAAALAAAFAGAFLVTGLVGTGPLAGSREDAGARQDCRVETISRQEEVRELRRQADGSIGVQTIRQPVMREVARCR